MSGLLKDLSGDPPLDKPRTKALFVKGIRYANAAAKFWPSLIDELREDFSDCSLIELTAMGAKELEQDSLYPEISLQRHFDQLRHADMEQVMKECLAELEMLGPPSAVQARLFHGQKELLVRNLPLDSVDSETFTYLMAWHLEWAGIPVSRWNSQAVSGSVNAEDRDRGLVYHMTFSLLSRHVSEGLFRRSLSVVPIVKSL